MKRLTALNGVLRGKSDLFSKFHVFMTFCSNHFRIGAFESPCSILCIFCIYKHLRAFASMCGTLIPHIKIVKMVKNHNFGHYDDDSCRCSWSTRRCSWHSKMQNVDQGLSNAPILKHFRLLTAEKSNFKIMKILWFSEYFLVYFGGRHCPTYRSGYEKAQNR